MIVLSEKLGAFAYSMIASDGTIYEMEVESLEEFSRNILLFRVLF